MPCVKGLNALCEGIGCPMRRDWMPCAKGLDALCKGTGCPVRRDFVRYFVIVFERGCDALVEKKVGFQPSPACCHVSHILFYYIKDCFRGALRE